MSQRSHPYKPPPPPPARAPGGGNAAVAGGGGGAVAGGGIGGDEHIDGDRIAGQLVDVERAGSIVEEAEAEALVAIRARIAQVHEGRDRDQIRMEMLAQVNRARLALVNDVQCLLPGELGVRARAGQEIARALVAPIDIFYDTFRSFLTEAFDNKVVFRECFDIAPTEDPDEHLTQEQEILRTSFELLMKEAIITDISAPAVAMEAFTRLLFDNSPGRMMLSAGGSIVAIILARDVLLMFANTVIGVMTFGWLNLQTLTNLVGFVYHNCSLVNIRNLLIYLNVAPGNAQRFIEAIRLYNREQRQYILMSIFLFGLNSIGRGAQYTADQITGILHNAGRYFNGVFDPRNDPVPDLDPNFGQQQAAAALNAAAAAAAAPAAAAAAPNIAPPPLPQHDQNNPSIFQTFINSGTDILTFIHRVFRSGWSRGLRFSRDCLRDVFTLYLVRPPRGQGLVCDLVNVTGRIARWGVEAIRDRSAQLDPDRPNREVFRLFAAVKGISDDDIRDPVRCEAALYNFSQELKGVTGAPDTPGTVRGVVKILQQPQNDRVLVYLTAQHLDALRHHFIQDYQPGEPGVVNTDRLQQACLGMRLFVFEQDMLENMVASNVVNVAERLPQADFNDTQEAIASVSQSLGRFQNFILEENETVTQSIFKKAKLRLQAFAYMANEAILEMAVVGGFQNLPENQHVVFARNIRRNRIPSKAHIRSAVVRSINSRGDLNDSQKQSILEMLIPRIDGINFEGLEGYLLGQDPRVGVPDTFLGSCRAFLTNPIPEGLQYAAGAIGAATRSGLSRCAALCTNVVVVSSGALRSATTGIGRVRALFGGIVGEEAVVLANQAAAAAQRAVPPPNIQDNDAAILVNIDNVSNVDTFERVPPRSPAHPGAMEHPGGGGAAYDTGEAHGMSDNPPGSGRGGRSRKRSAAKRTRRKGKQSSKNLKRKSRRYVRRASSRKGRT